MYIELFVWGNLGEVSLPVPVQVPPWAQALPGFLNLRSGNPCVPKSQESMHNVQSDRIAEIRSTLKRLR